MSRKSDLRFGQELTYRTAETSLSLRSTFTLGVDAVGATGTGDGGVDSQYFVWLGQGQLVQRLFETDTTMIIRAAGQFSSDALPAMEQFSLGGFDTVRGYLENQVVRDNAVVGSLEVRIPVLYQGGRSILELAPFTDIAYGWNSRFGRKALFFPAWASGCCSTRTGISICSSTGDIPCIRSPTAGVTSRIWASAFSSTFGFSNRG